MSRQFLGITKSEAMDLRKTQNSLLGCLQVTRFPKSIFIPQTLTLMVIH
ncbi:hypothetical protein HNQ64_000269 [Prosthecobacter dejongeii]|uniref:Uncharacterized protein n=1 Tax=Prosthecobacter dejongeii TaxID=48465 RepID=A0A7W8DNF3_9BACT|nr:hypothetical protein [Prosthecobacter dejongeii]